MCPLRLILLFLSATLAGFFVLKNLKSKQEDPDESSADPPFHESSSPSVPLSTKVFSAIASGFWTCVDMASGRYLWRNLVSSSKRSD
ncbi:PREDICTED: uncharacterized protein LOC104593797 [Nelumbo nucifera]|uniref:Uncharacterized protein LOC104593797 n=2 Tax=Nelumbo nucifera TaxID=4432 RepID=A0A1U7ZUL3_NELNU|nr:PREDICTED: uncharacterized protein LOC104593797 [Nelumbo nucifera]DAD38654.1 TPA_asm: hypothetical protein HUJ06_012976 [Nelumbo nucifera]